MFQCLNRSSKDAVEHTRMMTGSQFFMGLKSLFEDIRKRNDLKKVELQVFSYLNMAGDENTSSDICKNMNLNKAMVSKTLDALNKRGLVEYKTDEKDRRFVHYFITEKGQPIVEDLHNVWNYTHINLFKGLSDEEVNQFFDICKKMHHNMLEMQALNNEEENQKC